MKSSKKPKGSYARLKAKHDELINEIEDLKGRQKQFDELRAFTESEWKKKERIYKDAITHREKRIDYFIELFYAIDRVDQLKRKYDYESITFQDLDPLLKIAERKLSTWEYADKIKS